MHLQLSTQEILPLLLMQWIIHKLETKENENSTQLLFWYVVFSCIIKVQLCSEPEIIISNQYQEKKNQMWKVINLQGIDWKYFLLLLKRIERKKLVNTENELIILDCEFDLLLNTILNYNGQCKKEVILAIEHDSQVDDVTKIALTMHYVLFQALSLVLAKPLQKDNSWFGNKKL